MVVGTRAIEQHWAKRHLRKGNDWANPRYAGSPDEWVMSYWESRDHSHRRTLVDKIAARYPFTSILEIGCNCGPNLYLLAKRFPDVNITGIDINPRAIEKGRELLASEGITNVELIVAKADELGRFPDKSFDVVFTDATLIYIGPDKIAGVLQELLRVTRKTLVLMEMQPRHRNKTDKSDEYHLGLWLRDYRALLQQFIPVGGIRISPVTKDIWDETGWNESGAIIEADLITMEK
jgi:ubiquinone/menaquinone biosynthesis C-methylase UbiE